MRILRTLLTAALIFVAAAPTAVLIATAQPVGVTPMTSSSSPAVTQNTVTTTGPVKSETTISVGSMASQVLQWVVATFGAALGTLGSAFLVRVLKNQGFIGADLLRGKLQEIIVNGLNLAAQEAEKNMAGRGKVDIQNAVLVRAVQYTQEHGAEVLKKLGTDPNSQKAIEAIKARIATAVSDPSAPTPAVLDKNPTIPGPV